MRHGASADAPGVYSAHVYACPRLPSFACPTSAQVQIGSQRPHLSTQHCLPLPMPVTPPYLLLTTSPWSQLPRPHRSMPSCFWTRCEPQTCHFSPPPTLKCAGAQELFQHPRLRCSTQRRSWMRCRAPHLPHLSTFHTCVVQAHERGLDVQGGIAACQGTRGRDAGEAGERDTGARSRGSAVQCKAVRERAPDVRLVSRCCADSGLVGLRCLAGGMGDTAEAAVTHMQHNAAWCYMHGEDVLLLSHARTTFGGGTYLRRCYAGLMLPTTTAYSSSRFVFQA